MISKKSLSLPRTVFIVSDGIDEVIGNESEWHYFEMEFAN